MSFNGNSYAPGWAAGDGHFAPHTTAYNHQHHQPAQPSTSSAQHAPLPPNWDMMFDPPSQRYYFVDHANKRTTWDDPRFSSGGQHHVRHIPVHSDHGQEYVKTVPDHSARSHHPHYQQGPTQPQHSDFRSAAFPSHQHHAYVPHASTMGHAHHAAANDHTQHQHQPQRDFAHHHPQSHQQFGYSSMTQPTPPASAGSQTSDSSAHDAASPELPATAKANRALEDLQSRAKELQQNLAAGAITTEAAKKVMLELDELLTRQFVALDKIESHGDDAIRQQRKQGVLFAGEVEKLLNEIKKTFALKA